jgi:hypothetical protein
VVVLSKTAPLSLYKTTITPLTPSSPLSWIPFLFISYHTLSPIDIFSCVVEVGVGVGVIVGVGVGVFVAINSDLISEDEIELETAIIWIKICLAGCKLLHICAYYRPNVNYENCLE